MPPGLKLLFYSFFAASVFLVQDIRLHAVIAAVVVSGLFFIPFKKVKGGFVPIVVFLCFTLISNLFHQSGKVLYIIGAFVVTDEGMLLGALRAARVFEMVYAAKILTALTPLEEMIASLKRIAAPLERIGVPVHDFFSTMALTLQCFPVISLRLREAYKQSGEGKRAGLSSERVKQVISFCIPLFVESMRAPEKFFERKGEEGDGRKQNRN